ALFVSTALATVLGASADPRRAIMLYEGALGAGMALGPLVGGALGSISWRGPFLGTAVLMAIGLIAIVLFVPPTPIKRSARRSVAEPFRALVDSRVSILMLAALVYNYGYFTLLAYAPFPVAEASIRAGGQFTPLDLGLVFFGWGLMVALG
ncbi:MFS transporter, partial [Xanthomonas citri pv. citri]|nr:MFS transporter [Xanthomonas citri pv. citri]